MTATVRVRNLAALVTATHARGTQRDLARRVGRSPTAINNLMRGKRTVVALETAVLIEDALDVPRGSLFVADNLDIVGPYLERGAA